jgi:tight adherence protein C
MDELMASAFPVLAAVAPALGLVALAGLIAVPSLFWHRRRGAAIGGGDGSGGVSAHDHAARRCDALQRKLQQAGISERVSARSFRRGRWVAAVAAAMMAAGLAGRDIQGGLLGAACAGCMFWSLPGAWLSDRLRRRSWRMLCDLPIHLELLALVLESGLNFTGALREVLLKGPAGELRDELAILAGELSAGRPRQQAFEALAQRVALPALSSVVGVVRMAERQGMSLAPMLRAQARQLREERFHRAETLALQAPVKMLLPLVLFIFPCTFLILLFPLAGQLLQLWGGR